MVQLSATRCSCIAIVSVSLVSFAAITLCVACPVFIVVSVYFVIDSVRKILDTTSDLKFYRLNVRLLKDAVSTSNILYGIMRSEGKR
jgi:hypothetical protein